MDLSTMLAAWKADKLRQAPTKALLSRLEKAHDAKVVKIQESPVKTEETKRLELAEARRAFAAEYRKMRREILAGYDADIEAQRQTSNPPRSRELEEAMGRKTVVYLPKWERGYGEMLRDAERFKLEGDHAGLQLVTEHLGLVKESGVRRTLAEGVSEVLESYKPDAVRKAELEVRTIEGDKSRFELASGLRESGIIAARAGRYRPGQRGIESHDEALDGIEAETAPPSEAAAS
jgi:hypothetical protein